MRVVCFSLVQHGLDFLSCQGVDWRLAAFLLVELPHPRGRIALHIIILDRLVIHATHRRQKRNNCQEEH